MITTGIPTDDSMHDCHFRRHHFSRTADTVEAMIVATVSATTMAITCVTATFGTLGDVIAVDKGFCGFGSYLVYSQGLNRLCLTQIEGGTIRRKNRFRSR